MNKVSEEILDVYNNYVSNTRAQLYVLRNTKETQNDNTRYLQCTSAGMALFQSCKVLFQSLTERIYQCTDNVVHASRAQIDHPQEVVHKFRNIPQRVVGVIIQTIRYKPAYLNDTWKFNAIVR